MAVTVTATLRTKNGSERISRNMAMAIVELSITGTYVTGGFAYDLDGFFRTQTDIANVLWCGPSAETVTTNGDGIRWAYDRVNNYIKLYTGPTNTNMELYTGTEVGSTGLAITKLVIMAIGYNA